jgi:tetratricopeptide (TPR) repeat protein
LHAYATCLVKLKRIDKAAGVFGPSLALNPEDEREQVALAALELMAERPEDALATLQPLLQAGRPDASTLELEATALEDARKTPQAVATLRYLDFANMSFAHDSFQVGVEAVSDGIGQLPQAAPIWPVVPYTFSCSSTTRPRLILKLPVSWIPASP